MEPENFNTDETFSFDEFKKEESGFNDTENSILKALGEDKDDSTPAPTQPENKKDEEPKEEKTIDILKEQDEDKQEEPKTGEGDEKADEDKSNSDKSGSNPNDLIDEHGRVLAKAGKDRRMFEKGARFIGEKLAERERGYQNEIMQYKTRLDTYEQVFKQQKELGLNPQEIIVSQQFMSEWKKNPLEVVKSLLTEVKAMGYNIENIGSGTDIAAMKQLLEKELSPIKSEQQERQKQLSLQRQAEQEYTDFIRKYPDASIHINIIGELMLKDKTLSPDMAYIKLRQYFLDNKLDWSKEITKQSTENKTTPASTGTTNKSLPSTVNKQLSGTNQQQYASQENSYRDIVRDAMKQIKQN